MWEGKFGFFKFKVEYIEFFGVVFVDVVYCVGDKFFKEVYDFFFVFYEGYFVVNVLCFV